MPMEASQASYQQMESSNIRRYDSTINIIDHSKATRIIPWFLVFLCAMMAMSIYSSYTYSLEFLKTIILVVLCVLGVAGVLIAMKIPKDGNIYRPGVTYKIFRLDQDDNKKISILITVYMACIVAAVAWLVFLGEGNGKTLGRMIELGFTCLGLGITGYIASRVIKIHEDIDYVTNETLADIMDLTIDERVMASYTNFDTSMPIEQQMDDLEGNPNMFVMTQRQILFAFYTSRGWISYQCSLANITGMEINWNYLEFNGNIKLHIKDGDVPGRFTMYLSTVDNLAQYPTLVIRQILKTLDAYKSGAYAQMSTKRKRRRNVQGKATVGTPAQSQSAVSQQEETAAWESIPADRSEGGVRYIELCQEVYAGIKNAEPAISKRALDL